MGLAFQPPPAKGGVYAAKCFGDNLVYISGCGPSTDGTPITGKLGEAVTEEQGYLYARNSMLAFADAP